MRYLNDGFKNVYEKDLKTQEQYLGLIADEFRHCDVEILLDACGIFVPNNEYMKTHFGVECGLWDYTEKGTCIWSNAVIFPIRNITDEIVGINGYFPLNKLHKEAGETNYLYDIKYRISDKAVMNSSCYFFGVKGMQRKVLEDGYVILTDGTFDTLSLARAGLNSLALLGSSLSKQQIAFLSMLDRVYLAVDNDKAGVRLLRALRYRIRNARGIRFNKYKDVDDVLKSDNRNQFLEQVRKQIELDMPGDIIVRLV